LDLDTVIKAARTISGELEMDRLLERLAILLVENAGARRSVLLLDVDGALRVEAEARCEADGIRVEVGLGVPAARHPALPHSIINLVVRTHEDVILADAARDPLHGADPFVRDRRV